MKKSISILIVAVFLLVAVLAVLGTTAAEKDPTRFTPPDESVLPTWSNGDFWVYDTTFTTKFQGWADKQWKGNLNYSVQDTSDNSPGYECYRLGMSTEGGSIGDPIISGRMFIKKADLSLVEMNWTETGLDGTTPYTHFHEVYFESVDYYDYYQFPIKTSVAEVWWVNTTMYEEISNPPGMNHFEIYRKDDVKIQNQQMGWEEGVDKVQGNYTGQRIDGAGKSPSTDYDSRYYSPEFNNFIYRDFSFAFNDSGYWKGVQKIIKSNYQPAASNEPPQVTDPTTWTDDTAQANDQDTTTLRVTVTDDSGLAAEDPVTIDLSLIGKDANTVMTREGLTDRYSVSTTVAAGTAGGEKHLYVTATDNQGAVNDTVYVTLNVVSANNPPVVTNAKAVPDSIKNNGQETSLLSANVTDADDNLVNVTIDLAPIGGSSVQRMFDDGTNGDLAANDDVYSYQVVAAKTVSAGTYSLEVTADDSDTNEAKANITLTVTQWENNAPKLSDSKAEPDTVANNSQDKTLLSVKAVDEDGNPLTVKIDLSQIGGNKDTNMYDDGSHGDKASGDTVYSFETTVPPSVEAEQYTLVITASDSYDEVFSNIKITVVSGPPNNPPEIIDTKADPETVWNDGLDVVVFEAEVEDIDSDQNQTVTIDLSPIGGSPNEPMLDDGVFPDDIAGDWVYTTQYGIAAGISAGDYTFTITATDDGAPPLSDTAFVTITVKYLPPPSENNAEISFMTISPIPVTTTQRNITISAYVYDAEGDYFEAYTDLSGFGGGPRQRLYDDGTHGDAVADDNQYSVLFQVPLETENGEYTLRVWVEQNGILIDEESQTFQVQFDEQVDDDDDDDNGTGSILDDLPIIILLGALLFVIIIFLAVILRKPKGKEGEEGEEDDDSQAMVRI